RLHPAGLCDETRGGRTVETAADHRLQISQRSAQGTVAVAVLDNAIGAQGRQQRAQGSASGPALLNLCETLCRSPSGMVRANHPLLSERTSASRQPAAIRNLC